MARQLAATMATVALLAGCSADPGERSDSDSSGAAAIAVRDDAGRTVRLAAPARRVVSLVPSVTETIVAIGAADRLVGRTRYDTDPAVLDLPSVGGGLDPSLEAIVALRPDLVVAWRAAGYAALRSRLELLGIPLFAVAIEDTAGVFRAFGRFGVLLGEETAAARAAQALRDSFAAVATEGLLDPPPSVFYALLGDPPRTAGPKTFITELIRIAGGEPAFGDVTGDWPEVSLEAVLARQPDVVVIPEGEGALETTRLMERPGWKDLAAVRAGRIVAVPADLFNRPGPGMAEAARALHRALAGVWRPSAPAVGSR